MKETINALVDVTLVGNAAAVQVAAANPARQGVWVACTIADTRLGGDGTLGAKPDATHGITMEAGIAATHQPPLFIPIQGALFAFSAGNAVVSVSEQF